MDNIKEIDSDEFYEIIDKGKVLVQFGAPWCGPCKSVKALLLSISDSLLELGIKVAYCDLESNPDIQQDLEIQSIPVIVLFDHSNELGRITGATTVTEILKLVSS